MLTVTKDLLAVSELEVKRSRFIAQLSRAESIDESRQFVSNCRGRYPDARHHCSAFVVTLPGLNPQTHSSDDGEPAGTAGLPMLQVINGYQMENVVVVVTRYFGGILLGTGGLVRAYSQAVHEVIQAAQIVEVRELNWYGVKIPTFLAGRVESELRRTKWDVVAVRWSENVLIEIAAESQKLPDLTAKLAELLRAEPEIKQLGVLRREIPLSQKSV